MPNSSRCSTSRGHIEADYIKQRADQPLTDRLNLCDAYLALSHKQIIYLRGIECTTPRVESQINEQ